MRQINIEKEIVDRLTLFYRMSKEKATKLVYKYQEDIDAQLSGGNYNVKEITNIIECAEKLY